MNNRFMSRCPYRHKPTITLSSSRDFLIGNRVIFVCTDVGDTVARAAEDVGGDAQALHTRIDGRGGLLNVVILPVSGYELWVCVGTIDEVLVVEAVFLHDAVSQSVVQRCAFFGAGSELAQQRTVNDAVIEGGVRVAEVGHHVGLVAIRYRLVEVVGDGHGGR